MNVIQRPDKPQIPILLICGLQENYVFQSLFPKKYVELVVKKVLFSENKNSLSIQLISTLICKGQFNNNNNKIVKEQKN